MSNLDDMDLDELLKLGARRDNEAKIAKQGADDVKAELRRRWPEAVELGEDRIKAKITHVRKFDEAKAREVLSETELEQITVPKLDSTLAKKKFGEEQYELLSRPDTPRISFKLED